MTIQEGTLNGDQSKGVDLQRLAKTFPDGYLQVVRWARIIGLGLPTVHRHVLGALAYFANLDGWANPSQDTIALHAGYSRAAVCSTLRDLESLKILCSDLDRAEEGFHKRYRLQGYLTGWSAEFPETEEDLKKPIITRLCEENDRKDYVISRQDAELIELRQLLVEAGIECQPGAQEEKKKEEERYNSSSSSSEDRPSVNDVDTWSDPLVREVNEWVDKHWGSIRQTASNPAGWRIPKSKVIAWYVSHPDNFREQRDDRASSQGASRNSRRIGPGMHVEDQVAKFKAYEDELERRRAAPPSEEIDPEEEAEWQRQVAEINRMWDSWKE